MFMYQFILTPYGDCRRQVCLFLNYLGCCFRSFLFWLYLVTVDDRFVIPISDFDPSSGILDQLILAFFLRGDFDPISDHLNLVFRLYLGSEDGRFLPPE